MGYFKTQLSKIVRLSSKKEKVSIGTISVGLICRGWNMHVAGFVKEREELLSVFGANRILPQIEFISGNAYFYNPLDKFFYPLACWHCGAGYARSHRKAMKLLFRMCEKVDSGGKLERHYGDSNYNEGVVSRRRMVEFGNKRKKNETIYKWRKRLYLKYFDAVRSFRKHKRFVATVYFGIPFSVVCDILSGKLMSDGRGTFWEKGSKA